MWQLQFIILPIVAAVLFVITALCVWRWLVAENEFSGWSLASWFLGAFTLLAVGIWVVMCIPFDGKYWEIYKRSGEVTSVTNQWAGGSGDSTYRAYLVRLAGDPQSYVLDDPRASQLKGHEATLTCTVEFVYMGADRWNCVIAEVR